MDIYSVTPESASEHHSFDDRYRDRLAASAVAAESAGLSGTLVPHNLHEVDPWVIATYLGARTTRLIPLLAVQPACIPPHTAAACAAAYAVLYDRPLYFNLVAGARDDEMRRIGDTLTHDERYDRLREYARVLRGLLSGETVDLDGTYYRYQRFALEPCPDVLKECKVFLAGSSPASIRTAAEVADVVVTHPAPYPQWRTDFLDPLRARGFHGAVGIRIGIICRPEREEAWEIANTRFPQSWVGRQETLLKTRSQNVWSRELAQRAVTEEQAEADRDTYWLGAFSSGRASAPFLVGSYADVADRLGEYLEAGVGHVLLNGSYEEDFTHIRKGIDLAAALP